MGYGLRVMGFTISAVISVEKVFKGHRLLYHSTYGSRTFYDLWREQKRRRLWVMGYGLRVRGFTVLAVISAEKVFKAHRLLYHSTSGSRTLQDL